MAGIYKLDNGRAKVCKETQGGFNSVFIAPYKKVLRSEIVSDGVEITGFPVTFIYEFEVLGDVAFAQNENQNEGGKFQEISLSLNFKGVNAFDNSRFQKMLNRDYFIVILDRNSNYFLAGLQNGMTCDSLKSGANDIYNVSFSGQETDRSQYCKQLIGDQLIPITTFNFIFQNNANRTFENNDNQILQNG